MDYYKYIYDFFKGNSLRAIALQLLNILHGKSWFLSYTSLNKVFNVLKYLLYYTSMSDPIDIDKFIILL